MTQFCGTAYRALNPIYAGDPLSGEGAARYGGRFNARGCAALYLALSPETAIRESNQIGTLQPTTLIAYEADISPIFDAYDERLLASCAISLTDLSANDWRDRMTNARLAPTQQFADRLLNDGYAGLLVPSFARGASPTDRNLVLWRWDGNDAVRLRVVDQEGRLTQVYRER